ncbi:cupin-like domain-containing protein [Luteimonas marina]|uniref:Cupin-like domain-containing protein n=1 Tax=Luteimonas marina TaxID=488485 RepID=A0A5C5U0K0_9GAMM|nr:cupin-like domain-containing protein [Luteimonas marina]
MLQSIDALPRVAGAPADKCLEESLSATRPQVIRGLVAEWPLVRAAKTSDAAAVAYLRGFANDATPAVATVAPPEAGGRIFYDDAFEGFNFRREQIPISVALATLLKYGSDAAAPMIYLGATTLETYLPGLAAENGVDLGQRQPLASIWIGNRSRVPAHQDLPDNLACVAAGRRRVILFPPDQLANLYIGPLDFTPAGQPVSLVDPTAPDLARFPRFAEAWRHAVVAELEAGDALFIPSMWWHHIEALDPFNVLVNYWWRRSPDYLDAPVNALMAAILCIRDLPAGQREIWQDVFRHYVFEFDAEAVAGHIPPAARHALAPLDEASASHLRAHLARRLAR